MATSNVTSTPRPVPTASTALRPPPVDNDTTLIARAEALNAFMRMQPAANQARLAASNGPPPRTPPVAANPQSTSNSSCLCFGRSPDPPPTNSNRPHREYYPDNLSVQPNPHPWENRMEWLIVSCIDFLESHGLHERNLFAVSAVDDLVRETTIPLRSPMPAHTDPHVAAGVIKAKIRHAQEPLINKGCLRDYIEALGEGLASNDGSSSSPAVIEGVSTDPHDTVAPTFRDTFLARTIESTIAYHGNRRAYILARFMRLLGRVSANIESSRMNAHSLAKCVAPSMLHWDPNANFALLMLGRITAYVKKMIEEARVYDEQLCLKIDQVGQNGAW